MYANQYVARDAFGFALNYFDNDYKPVSTTVDPFPGYSAYLNTEFRPLYNGNISSMVSTNRVFENAALYPDSATMLFNYRYDQLNRITGMDVYNKFNRNGNSFSALTRLDKFKERVSYDPNGNILKYLRNGDGNGNTAHLRMDSLQYNYYAGTNRLRSVRDSVPASWYGANATDKIVDIDNQVDTDNYIYDSIGNLIQDKAEKITNINWNVYGKITGINRDAGTQVPASEISYTYDASGNRISKSVEKGGRKTFTWYVRDAQGNVMATYSSDAPAATPLPSFALIESERYIYGSSRLGVVTVAQAVDNGNAGPAAVVDTGGVFLRGERMYELSNHLGNVLVTISDKKKGIADPITSSLISHFEPIMLSGTDYYPFGMAMRVGGDNQYKYGFNGKENDNEVKWGMGNQQDYGMRVYDNRLGRFLSVDPLTKDFPWYTPYQFAGNKPIIAVDLDGEEERIVISRISNGKQDGPVQTLTYKDTEFETLIKNYPKELKGVKPGQGTLYIDQFRFTGITNIGNPNYDNYNYYEKGDGSELTTSYQHYTNGFARWAMTSKKSPQNWRLENLGINAAAFGADLSISKKGNIYFPNDGLFHDLSGEGKGTISVRYIGDNMNNGYVNINSSLSVEGGGARKYGASKSDIKSDWELFGYMSLMSSGAPPAAGSTTGESVTTVKIGIIKIQYTYVPKTDKFDLKIGATTNPGYEYKNVIKGKLTVTSQTVLKHKF